MLKRISNQRGFTLVELIVVMSIVGLVIGSVGLFLVNNVKAFHKDQNQEIVQEQVQLAMDKVIKLAMGGQSIEAPEISEDLSLKTWTIDTDEGPVKIFYDEASDRLSYQLSGDPDDILIAEYINSFTIKDTHGGATGPDDPGIEITVGAKITKSRVELTNQVFFRN